LKIFGGKSSTSPISDLIWDSHSSPLRINFPRMNRIVEKFAALKRAGKKAFIVYIGAGDPNLAATRELALAFDQAGVDILELGVPFSDPLADGLVNQLAAQRGLESGTTPPKLLKTVSEIRKKSEVPIVLYIYFNLIHRVGMEKFIRDAAKAGADPAPVSAEAAATEEKARAKAAAEEAKRGALEDARRAVDEAEEAVLLATDEEQVRMDRLRELEEQVTDARRSVDEARVHLRRAEIKQRRVTDALRRLGG